MNLKDGSSCLLDTDCLHGFCKYNICENPSVETVPGVPCSLSSDACPKGMYCSPWSLRCTPLGHKPNSAKCQSGADCQAGKYCWGWHRACEPTLKIDDPCDIFDFWIRDGRQCPQGSACIIDLCRQICSLPSDSSNATATGCPKELTCKPLGDFLSPNLAICVPPDVEVGVKKPPPPLSLLAMLKMWMLIPISVVLVIIGIVCVMKCRRRRPGNIPSHN